MSLAWPGAQMSTVVKVRNIDTKLDRSTFSFYWRSEAFSKCGLRYSLHELGWTVKVINERFSFRFTPNYDGHVL